MAGRHQNGINGVSLLPADKPDGWEMLHAAEGVLHAAEGAPLCARRTSCARRGMLRLTPQESISELKRAQESTAPQASTSEHSLVVGMVGYRQLSKSAHGGVAAWQGTRLSALDGWRRSVHQAARACLARPGPWRPGAGRWV